MIFHIISETLNMLIYHIRVSKGISSIFFLIHLFGCWYCCCCLLNIPFQLNLTSLKRFPQNITLYFLHISRMYCTIYFRKLWRCLLEGLKHFIKNTFENRVINFTVIAEIIYALQVGRHCSELCLSLYKFIYISTITIWKE